MDYKIDESVKNKLRGINPVLGEFIYKPTELYKGIEDKYIPKFTLVPLKRLDFLKLQNASVDDINNILKKCIKKWENLLDAETLQPIEFDEGKIDYLGIKLTNAILKEILRVSCLTDEEELGLK